MMARFLAVAAVAAVARADVRLVYSVENPTPETMAAVNTQHPDCSSFYRVDLSAKYTTQGNDLAMTNKDGADNSYATSKLRDEIDLNFGPEYDNLQLIGQNRVGFPGKTDSEKQARARSLNSVTALTEEGATPNGFHKALLHQYYGVCVEVVGIQDDNNRKNNIGIEPEASLGGRWIEVMAQTVHANQAICVTDFGRLDTHDDPVHAACGQGEVYTCRESNIPIAGVRGIKPLYPAAGDITNRNRPYGRSGAGSVMLKFECQSNCDDPHYAFFFRVAASQERPVLNNGVLQQRDGENWCGMREGDDFPSSLLNPYPKNYVEPAVFDQQLSSATGVYASAVAAVVAVLAALL